MCDFVCKLRYLFLLLFLFLCLFFHCRVTCPNVKVVRKLTSQLRYMMNFSVVNTNFVKTAETEALVQNIPGLNEDSSSFRIQSLVT